jgi:hypothetical protein
MGAILAFTRVHFGPTLQSGLYAGLSIAFGILMARLVEFPALALRDRLFPGVNGATIVIQAPKAQLPAASQSLAIDI